MRYASGMKRRVYKSKRGGKKKIVRKALAKSWKKSVSKVVKRVINNQAETKKQVYQVGLQPSCLQVTTTSVVGNWIICSPGNSNFLNLTVGTGNNNRLGNEVRTKKLTLDYVIYPASYNATTNPSMLPQEVIIYFFKIKGGQNDVFDTTYLSRFYENGSGTTSPVGYLLDCCNKINSDQFTYLTHRRHKVGRSVIGTTANLTAPNYNSATNNDFKWNIVSSINLTKYCQKNIKWTDGIADAQTSYIHMLIQTVAADGSLQSANTILPIGVLGKVYYEYTDM